MFKILLHFTFLEVCIFDIKTLTKTLEMKNWAERHFWDVFLWSVLKPETGRTVSLLPIKTHIINLMDKEGKHSMDSKTHL